MRISRTVACLAVLARLQASLPEPPRQHSSWLAVRTADIPDYVPDIVATLFDAGLADPRDGEYREIEIRVAQGQTPITTTHGWVFQQGFAVCWDGRVHHVEHAGPPADLQTDVSAPKSTFWSEATIHAPPYAGPVGVALLMRLGETELVRKMLLAMPPLGQNLESDSERFDKGNWFQLAVTSWLSGIFHQAVEAHAAGDDSLTIDVTQLLQTARPLLESSWIRMERPANMTQKSLLEFLDPVPALRADSERRLKQPRRAPLNAQIIKQMPRAERIHELIDRLEDVNEQQFSQPGGVWIMGSPICKLLAEEDADAVDPLLDAFDQDTRLTRSFSYGRNFFPTRHLISVSEAALDVLRNYYQISVFRWKDNAEARAWMVRNKYRTVAQRGLDLLAGDSNDEIQWLDAAQLLLRSGKSGVVGEELRGNSSPSVSELLAKRAQEMKTNWAIDVGLLLYQWDPAAALPALQMLAHRWDGAAQEGRIAAARLQLGDTAVAREWAAAIHPNQDVPLAQLAPLWTSPTNEDLQVLARKLFAEPGAPMSPTGRRAGELINSTLLINPVFRESVLAGLERTEEIGSAERLPDGTRRVTGPGGYQQASLAAGLAAHPPGKQSIRISDFIAWQLSDIEGFPKFDIEWTTSEKDAALAPMAGFLRAHANDLRPITSGMPLRPGVTLVQK